MQVENLTVFILKLGYCELSYNESGLPTLVVGECPVRTRYRWHEIA